MSKAAYKRVMLKLSGEALAAGADGIYNYSILENISAAVCECVSLGAQVAMVVGAGNIWRGRQGGGMDRARADYMGILATVINSIALQDSLIHAGVPARVMTSMTLGGITERFSRDQAVAHLERGNVVICGGGTGNPFFSTDTAAALRAAELDCDIILMAKNIDGVYTADPRKDPTAKKIDEIEYAEILTEQLGVIDLTASAFLQDAGIPSLIFGLDKPENIVKAVKGEIMGTIIKGDDKK